MPPGLELSLRRLELRNLRRRKVVGRLRERHYAMRIALFVACIFPAVAMVLTRLGLGRDRQIPTLQPLIPHHSRARWRSALLVLEP